MESARHLAALQSVLDPGSAEVLPIDSLRSAAAARRPSPVVEMVRVSKVFEGAGRAAPPAVSDVSLALAPGSATLICGPSGSGKTTLLSLIGCMTRPTSGRIRVDGRDVSRLPEDRLAELRRRSFGFVFQGNHLIQGATALDNVMLPALPCPDCRPGLRRRALELLEGLGLGDRARRRVEWLSGGEQQRVAIARALINDPRVILADEPTAHLDRETAWRFIDLVDRMLTNGLTLVVASHDPLVAGCGRFDGVVELRDGRAA